MAYVKFEQYWHSGSTSCEVIVQICKIEYSTMMQLPSSWYPTVISGRRALFRTHPDPEQLMYRGAWNQWERYERGDVVLHFGSTWLARGENVNSKPEDGSPTWLSVEGVGSP